MLEDNDILPSWCMNKGYFTGTICVSVSGNSYFCPAPQILDSQISASQSSAAFLPGQALSRSQLRLLKVVTLLSCWTANFQRNINFNWASTWKTKNHLEFCWTGFDSTDWLHTTIKPSTSMNHTAYVCMYIKLFTNADNNVQTVPARGHYEAHGRRQP